MRTLLLAGAVLGGLTSPGHARGTTSTAPVAETPHVYVERFDPGGDTPSHVKVIRREFQAAEADSSDSIPVERSLDRAALSTALEETPTDQLEESAGFSSLERFLIRLSIEQRNFRGRAQSPPASVNYPSGSDPLEPGFTEPYFFDRDIAVGFESSPGPDQDPVRLVDRFFLGEPQVRGFDIRGVGPRIKRIPFDANGVPVTDGEQIVDDSIGGRVYYVGRAELEIPLGSSVREMGLRPSIFVDMGALHGIEDPQTNPLALDRCFDAGGNATPRPEGGTCDPNTILVPGIQAFDERLIGDTPKPRLSVGYGVNWNSPFGPFRIDIARALVQAEGDDTKLSTFNVGTAF